MRSLLVFKEEIFCSPPPGFEPFLHGTKGTTYELCLLIDETGEKIRNSSLKKRNTHMTKSRWPNEYDRSITMTNLNN